MLRRLSVHIFLALSSESAEPGNPPLLIAVSETTATSVSAYPRRGVSPKPRKASNPPFEELTSPVCPPTSSESLTPRWRTSGVSS